MKRVLGTWLLVVLTGFLAACGPVRKSVFPPLVTVQQLHVDARGQWHMQLRIQNNSYQGMKFTGVQLGMKVHGIPAGHIDATVNLDIPALSVDIANVQMTPSRAAARQLASGGESVPYRLAGTVSAIPDQETKARSFEVDSGTSHSLSPTPGLTNTWR
jgi:hypothetical protein